MSRAHRVATLLQATGLQRAGASAWHGVAEICHHRIGDARDTPGDPGLYGATVDEFDDELRLLRREFELITPGDLDAALKHRGRAVLLTFDDGYRDMLDAALPVLEAHDARAAFFIASSFIDRPRMPWWDELSWIARTAGLPDHAPAWIARYKTLEPSRAERWLARLADRNRTGRAPAELAADQWLTWDGVRALHDAGMTIGGHTDTHPVLARLSVERQREEIERGLDRIAREIGRHPRWFAYPVGGPASWTASTEQLLVEAGIERAFSFYGGANPVWRRRPYDMRRIWVPADTRVARARIDLPAVFARR